MGLRVFIAVVAAAAAAVGFVLPASRVKEPPAQSQIPLLELGRS